MTSEQSAARAADETETIGSECRELMTEISVGAVMARGMAHGILEIRRDLAAQQFQFVTRALTRLTPEIEAAPLTPAGLAHRRDLIDQIAIGTSLALEIAAELVEARGDHASRHVQFVLESLERAINSLAADLAARFD